ncbi:2109_t:CDS:2 [Ambispora leptoticha]|uniref:2109_t:CDS:1 n=1 Tax=Ambispora leptoticha TaxID=144679 RepID=A0A9N9D0W4_9GLOM|nr:2109_t:CDS:2 [Ambispora leptoticha]
MALQKLKIFSLFKLEILRGNGAHRSQSIQRRNDSLSLKAKAVSVAMSTPSTLVNYGELGAMRLLHVKEGDHTYGRPHATCVQWNAKTAQYVHSVTGEQIKLNSKVYTVSWTSCLTVYWKLTDEGEIDMSEEV